MWLCGCLRAIVCEHSIMLHVTRTKKKKSKFQVWILPTIYCFCIIKIKFKIIFKNCKKNSLLNYYKFRTISATICLFIDLFIDSEHAPSWCYYSWKLLSLNSFIYCVFAMYVLMHTLIQMHRPKKDMTCSDPSLFTSFPWDKVFHWTWRRDNS